MLFEENYSTTLRQVHFGKSSKTCRVQDCLKYTCMSYRLTFKTIDRSFVNDRGILYGFLLCLEWGPSDIKWKLCYINYLLSFIEIKAAQDGLVTQQGLHKNIFRPFPAREKKLGKQADRNRQHVQSIRLEKYGNRNFRNRKLESRTSYFMFPLPRTCFPFVCSRYFKNTNVGLFVGRKRFL